MNAQWDLGKLPGFAVGGGGGGGKGVAATFRGKRMGVRVEWATGTCEGGRAAKRSSCGFTGTGRVPQSRDGESLLLGAQS